MSKKRIESTLKSRILVDNYFPIERPEEEIKEKLVKDMVHYLMEHDLVNYHICRTSPGGYTLYESEITIVKYEDAADE